MAVKARLVTVQTIPTKLSSDPTDRTAGAGIWVKVPAASAGLVRFGGASVTWSQGFPADEVSYESLQGGEALYAIVQNTPVVVNVLEGGV